ncbi:hypothetical protein MMC08_005034 [Hypocenomyce scalaris]|nr:hypothetical protein [Hypocenomyce scalaris]
MKVQRGTRGWKGRRARLQRRRERRPRPALPDTPTQVDDMPSSVTSNQPDPITEEDWRDLFDTAALEQDSPNDLYQSSRNTCEIERLIETMLKLCRDRLQCLDDSCWHIACDSGTRFPSELYTIREDLKARMGKLQKRAGSAAAEKIYDDSGVEAFGISPEAAVERAWLQSLIETISACTGEDE